MKRPVFLLLLLMPLFVVAQTNELPAEFRDVEVFEKTGRPLPFDLIFANENGDSVSIGDLFKSGKPVILNPVYYECPMLCTLVLNGLTDGMRELDLELGRDYHVVTFSINPNEHAPLARSKKKAHLDVLSKPADSSAWHFLTGSKSAIDSLTSSIGFGYRWDETTQQYAHAAAIVFASPSGVVTRYLYGIEFKPFDLKKALSEASNGTIGSNIDKIVMYCFTYDPTLRSYVPHAINMMKIGGLLTMLLLGGFLTFMWSKERFTNKKPLNV